jgi:hypothetical protein
MHTMHTHDTNARDERVQRAAANHLGYRAQSRSKRRSSSAKLAAIRRAANVRAGWHEMRKRARDPEDGALFKPLGKSCTHRACGALIRV